MKTIVEGGALDAGHLAQPPAFNGAIGVDLVAFAITQTDKLQHHVSRGLPVLSGLPW